MKLLRNGIWGNLNLSFWIIVTQNMSKMNLLLFPVRWELWSSCQHHHHEWPPKLCLLMPSLMPSHRDCISHDLVRGIIRAFILDRIVKSRTDELSPQPRVHSLTEFTAILWVEAGLSDSRDSGRLLMQLQSGCVITISFTFLILFHLAPLPSTLYFKDHPRHHIISFQVFNQVHLIPWSVDHWPHVATIRLSAVRASWVCNGQKIIQDKMCMSVQRPKDNSELNVHECVSHWADTFHLLSYHARPVNTAQRTMTQIHHYIVIWVIEFLL